MNINSPLKDFFKLLVERFYEEAKYIDLSNLTESFKKSYIYKSKIEKKKNFKFILFDIIIFDFVK